MRNFINILNELALSDFHGGGQDGTHVRIYDIVWDTDGEDVNLPDSVIMEIEDGDIEDMQEAIVDGLSNAYGWCVSSFQYAFI